MVVDLRPFCLLRQLLRHVNVWPLQLGTPCFKRPPRSVTWQGRRLRQGGSRDNRFSHSILRPFFARCMSAMRSQAARLTIPLRFAQRPAMAGHPDVMQYPGVENRPSHVQLEGFACTCNLLMGCGCSEWTVRVVRKRVRQYLGDCWVNRMQSKSMGVASPGPEGLEAARRRQLALQHQRSIQCILQCPHTCHAPGGQCLYQEMGLAELHRDGAGLGGAQEKQGEPSRRCREQGGEGGIGRTASVRRCSRMPCSAARPTSARLSP